MSLYRSITDALLVFVDKVVAHYERRLQEKESQMADLTQQIRAMQDKIRKLDEVQASAAELLTRYNELVKQNLSNKAALDELTQIFDQEIDETVAAMTENTEVEEPEDPEEPDEIDPSGNEPFNPSGNTPANPTGASRTSGRKSGSAGGQKASKSGGKK